MNKIDRHYCSLNFTNNVFRLSLCQLVVLLHCFGDSWSFPGSSCFDPVWRSELFFLFCFNWLIGWFAGIQLTPCNAEYVKDWSMSKHERTHLDLGTWLRIAFRFIRIRNSNLLCRQEYRIALLFFFLKICMICIAIYILFLYESQKHLYILLPDSS